MGVPKIIVWAIRKFLDMLIIDSGLKHPPGSSANDAAPQKT